MQRTHARRTSDIPEHGVSFPPFQMWGQARDLNVTKVSLHLLRFNLKQAISQASLVAQW